MDPTGGQGDYSVLALLGLFGVFAAGIAADAILSTREPEPEDDDGGHQDDDGRDFPNVDLLGEPLAEDPLPSAGPHAPHDAGLRVTGTEEGDILAGGDLGDRILAKDGDDLVDARAGDDVIEAGAGDDAVWAGTGDDSLYGGVGNDSLQGQDGDDLVLGGAGSDELSGQMGDDTLRGGEGNDTLAGGSGSDTLDGNAGDDRLSGLVGQDEDSHVDFLNGGTGNDTMIPGSGDHAYGDAGADEFIIHDWLRQGGVAHVTDYDATLDRLVVVYDPAVHPDPILTLEVTPDGSESTLLLDGLPMATIRGDIVDLAEIDLRAA
jgi:Ca2+-binding RTX toxin-like protein